MGERLLPRLRRLAAVYVRAAPLVLIPESRNGLLCDLRVLETVSIVIENRELVSAHDVRSRLCLDLSPDVSYSSFEDGGNRRMDLAFLIIPDNLESPGDRELANVPALCDDLTHDEREVYYRTS